MTIYYITVSPKTDTMQAKRAAIMFKGDLTTEEIRRNITVQIRVAVKLREVLKERGINLPNSDLPVPYFSTPAKKQGFRWVGGFIEGMEYSMERTECVKEEDLPESLFHTI